LFFTRQQVDNRPRTVVEVDQYVLPIQTYFIYKKNLKKKPSSFFYMNQDCFFIINNIKKIELRPSIGFAATNLVMFMHARDDDTGISCFVLDGGDG
jgi:hypothetical protein